MTTTPDILTRLDSILAQLKAMRVRRHFLEWPVGHPEAPKPRPSFVRDFEQLHGSAPESADRVLQQAGGSQ